MGPPSSLYNLSHDIWMNGVIITDPYSDENKEGMFSYEVGWDKNVSLRQSNKWLKWDAVKGMWQSGLNERIHYVIGGVTPLDAT